MHVCTTSASTSTEERAECCTCAEAMVRASTSSARGRRRRSLSCSHFRLAPLARPVNRLASLAASAPVSGFWLRLRLLVSSTLLYSSLLSVSLELSHTEHTSRLLCIRTRLLTAPFDERISHCRRHSNPNSSRDFLRAVDSHPSRSPSGDRVARSINQSIDRSSIQPAADSEPTSAGAEAAWRIGTWNGSSSCCRLGRWRAHVRVLA